MPTSAWRNVGAGVAFLFATLIAERTSGIIIDSLNSNLEQGGFIPVADMPPVGLRPADDFAVGFLSGPNSATTISAVPIAPNYVITADHWDLGDPTWLTDSVIFAGRNRQQLFKVVDVRHIPDIDVVVLKIGPTQQYPATGLNSWVSLYDDEESQGMTFAIGNYGWQQKRNVSNPVNPFLVPVSPVPRGSLAWGRNRLESATTTLRLNQTFPVEPDHVDYEAVLHYEPGDSGSGWYIKNGWEWQIDGLTYTPYRTFTRFSIPENRQLIADAVQDMGGSLPATSPAAAPPAPTKTFSGAGAWNTPGNWSSIGTPNGRDTVRVSGNADIGPGSASAAELFVGKVGESNRLTLTTGGTLQVAESIYVGPEVNTDALLESRAGSTIAAESLFVGVYGDGIFTATGGDANINFVNVGTKNGSTGRIFLAGNSAPINLTSKKIIIGRDTGSTGILNIDPTAPVTVNTSELVVGRQGYGTLIVNNGGSIIAGGLVTVGSQGTVTGDGRITGNLSNAGVVAPGDEAGPLNLSGNYTQTFSGKLQIQLGGTDVGTYDQLLVSGSATLGGILQVSLSNGFAPSPLDSFKILGFASRSGSFASLQLPTLGGWLNWDISRLYTDGVLSVAGSSSDYFDTNADFDDNGVVDDKDIDILWRIVRGTGADPGNNDNADLNLDGYVNQADVDTMLASKLTAGPNRRYGDADLSGGSLTLVDYGLWRTGTGGWAGGDFDGSGGVPDFQDYNLWRTGPTQFPGTIGPHGGGGATGGGFVPEPSTLVLAAIGLLAGLIKLCRTIMTDKGWTALTTPSPGHPIAR